MEQEPCSPGSRQVHLAIALTGQFSDLSALTLAVGLIFTP